MGQCVHPKKWHIYAKFAGMISCWFVRGYAQHGQKREIKSDRSPPPQAIQAGADYLVIGRPITAAAEPELAWKRISQELTTVV